MNWEAFVRNFDMAGYLERNQGTRSRPDVWMKGAIHGFAYPSLGAVHNLPFLMDPWSHRSSIFEEWNIGKEEKMWREWEFIGEKLDCNGATRAPEDFRSMGKGKEKVCQDCRDMGELGQSMQVAAITECKKWGLRIWLQINIFLELWNVEEYDVWWSSMLAGPPQIY